MIFLFIGIIFFIVLFLLTKKKLALRRPYVNEFILQQIEDMVKNNNNYRIISNLTFLDAKFFFLDVFNRPSFNDTFYASTLIDDKKISIAISRHKPKGIHITVFHEYKYDSNTLPIPKELSPGDYSVVKAPMNY